MLMYRRGIMSLFFVSLLLFSSSCVFAADDGKKLWQTKCSRCHSPNLVESHKGYSKEQWMGVIDRMKVSGLQITSEEQGAVAQYLADNIKK